MLPAEGEHAGDDPGELTLAIAGNAGDADDLAGAELSDTSESAPPRRPVR